VDLLGSSAKVAHSLREGWENAVMYLAPHSRAEGANMCIMAGKCAQGCLTSAGQLGMAPAEVSKIFKTRVYQADQNLFLNLLILDIARFLSGLKTKERNYKDKGELAAGATLKPTVRLNGTSDEPWEIIPIRIMPELMVSLKRVRGDISKYLAKDLAAGKTYRNIYEVFPGLQFYDYTKYGISARKKEYRNAYGNVAWPKNYHLTYSLSEKSGSPALAIEALKAGHSVAAVYNTKVQEVEAWRKILTPAKRGDRTAVIEYYPGGKPKRKGVKLPSPKRKKVLRPESETEKALIVRMLEQGKPYPWQVIPKTIPLAGRTVGVQNADVTDLRFKDGTYQGWGKIAWLSAKGDAIRDCTGFVRDFASITAQDFGGPIKTFDPWQRMGYEGGCRVHEGQPDLPISGIPTPEDPLGTLSMKFPYRTWEEALDTGRPPKTKSPFDKKLTAKEKREGKKPYPIGTVAPRFDWGRVQAALRYGGCVFGGSAEGLAITVLTGAPKLYTGRTPMVESNKLQISKEVINDVAFALMEAAEKRGLILYSRIYRGQTEVYVGAPGSECPPPEAWRQQFLKDRMDRPRSMIKRRNPKRRSRR